jgi:hypothetical protein
MQVTLSPGQNGGVYVVADMGGSGVATGKIGLEVLPGEKLFGVTFETLQSLGYGIRDITPSFSATITKGADR